MALIATHTSATRADELSELVAAVAAGEKTVGLLQSDIRRLEFDSLPRYLPKQDLPDPEVLDGVLNAMNIRTTFDYMLNAYDYDYTDLDSYTSTAYDDFWLNRPTLAREGFFRPVPGVVTSRFGWRPQFGRIHHGVDLRLNIGDTVRAAISGVVERVAFDYDGYGHYVVMRHSDGMETVYGHLQYALVSQGQFLELGSPLGIGGNTGNSTGPHLHFEARMGGVAVDPTLIFDFNGRYPAAGLRATGLQTNRDLKKEPGTSTYASKSLSGKRTYIVRQGDTPRSIAKRAGISVMRLCQLNMIRDNDPLPIGRMLKLN